MIENSFIKNSFYIFIISNLTNFLTYIFQFIISRSLDIEVYGKFAFLNSFINMAIFPVGVLPLLISIIVSNNKKIDSIKIIKSIYTNIYYLLGIVFLVSITGLYIIVNYFDQNLTINEQIILILYSLSLILPPFVLGLLQAFRMYKSSSFVSFLYLFFKVTLILIVSIIYNLSINIIFLLMVLSIITSFVIGNIILLKKSVTKIRNNYKKLSINFFNYWKYILPFLFIYISNIILLNLDIIIINFIFDNYITGIYTPYALIGKIAYYLFIGLSQIYFTETLYRDEKISKDFFKSFLICVLIFIFTYLLFNIFSEEIIKITFGGKYESSSNFLIYTLIFNFILSINVLIQNSLVASKKYVCIYFNYLICFSIVFLSIFFKQKIEFILLIFVLLFFINFLISSILFVNKKKLNIISFR